MQVLLSLAASVGATGDFGHVLLQEFSFPPDWTNLNQGSYGACPKVVQAARQRFQEDMDSNPEAYFRTNFSGDGRTKFADLVDDARQAVARYLDVDTDTVVLVENASHGINVVLRSMARFLRPDQAVLYFDTAYFMVSKTLRWLGGELEGTPRSSQLQTPLVQVNITDLLPEISRAGVQRMTQAALKANPSVGMCVFSHITSTPGLILPIKELIQDCHEAGAVVLVDGAHVPGQIPVNLTDLDADFYVGNGHKWLFSPKGSAFTYVHPRVQKFVYPSVIDGGPDPTAFTQEFMWQGTFDYSAYIALPDALAWRARLGEERIMAYMKEVAEQGGQHLAARFNTTLMPSNPTERHAMQGALVNVRLPCGLGGEPACPEDLAPRIVRDARTFVPVGEYAGKGRGMWARLSASVYNEVSDFQHYGEAVERVLQQQVVV